MAWYRGQQTQALHYLEEAVRLARQHQYLEELGFALCCIGGGLWFEYGNYAEAEQCLQEGLQIAQQFGQRENLCYAYNNLACIALNRGDFARAHAYCQQGQEQARLIQHRALLSILLETQGECFLAQHEYSRAEQILQEAVAIARQIQHAEFLCLSLCFLGKAIGYVEAYDRARGYFQESLTLVQQLSAPLLIIILLTTWGETELFHSQFATARQHFLEGLVLEAEEQRYPEMLARAHYGLADIALHEQDREKAREHAAESVRLFKRIGHYKVQEVQAWIEALS